jgi:hypothetical protein
VKTLWQDPIGRHVVIAVALKLCLLTALWLCEPPRIFRRSPGLSQAAIDS